MEKLDGIPEGMSVEEATKIAEKALEKLLKRRAARANRLLKTLSPNEIWNEFSRSNQHLPRYSNDD